MFQVFLISSTSCCFVLILLKIILIRERSLIMSFYEDGRVVLVIVVTDLSPKNVFCVKIIFMQATSDNRPVGAHISI